MDKTQRILAFRYAQAYINLVYGQLSLKSIVSFQDAAAYFSCHKQACFLMDLSLLSSEKKEEALRHCIQRYGLPAGTEKLLGLLLAHKRSEIIGQVFNACIVLYKKRAQIMTFAVESSLALSEKEKHDIEQFIQRQVSGTVLCSYSVTPALIAGVRIHNENYRWEYSAQAQLRALYTSVRR